MNRQKARIQLAGIHERVVNARTYFQHKHSRTIVAENQAVIGKQDENPSSGRVIGDVGWSGFTAKLAYKAAEKGEHLVKLDQWLASTKSCHYCGHKMPEILLNKRIW